MTPSHITLRANPVLVARIDELAQARGSSRSAAIKAAIVEATTPKDAPAVPDEREVLVLLGEAARGGNVAAMRVLWTYHRERKRTRPGKDGMSVIDELARRRLGGRAS